MRNGSANTRPRGRNRLDTSEARMGLRSVFGCGIRRGPSGPGARDPRKVEWRLSAPDCSDEPTLQEPIGDPGRFQWHEVKKVDYYWIDWQAICRRT